MEFRAVGNRCAVDLNHFNLNIEPDQTFAILDREGFELISVDVITLARQCVGVSKYRRGAKPSEAPRVFDCSSLIKWLYGMRGIWLPRRSIQQREVGEIINVESLAAGDAVFVSGRIDYYENNPADGVGHVGIFTSSNSVIHAANSRLGVIESSLEDFLGTEKFRGARRYIPKGTNVLTFKTPAHREVETADDIKWIIRQSLPTLDKEIC